MSREEKAKDLRRALVKHAKGHPELSQNELRIVLALERAAARLTAHKRLSQHLIFKGGFVLFKLTDSPRFTRDLDALARGLPSETLPELVREALDFDLDDGLWFGDYEFQDLSVEDHYPGVRVTCGFQLGDPPAQAKLKKLSRIHVDFAFGDALSSGGDQTKMQPLLGDLGPVSWRVYPPEYIFSEKLQTVFNRGSANSRAKDIYDLVFLFPRCRNRRKLMDAIKSTFAARATPLPDSLGDAIGSIDTTILESAWKSVFLPEGSMSFEECWLMLIEILKVLDTPAAP